VRKNRKIALNLKGGDAGFTARRVKGVSILGELGAKGREPAPVLYSRDSGASGSRKKKTSS